jgi:hypothetical protein
MRTRQPLDENHKRFLAEEISRHINVAADPLHGMHRIARFLVDSLLWCWSADGIDSDGVARRDLLKYDFNFQRHTTSAALNFDQFGRGGLRHEHAVPRKSLIELLLHRRATPHETYDLLTRMCFGVIITTKQDASIYENNKSLRDGMPFPLKWDTQSDLLLSRYAPFKEELRPPRGERPDPG